MNNKTQLIVIAVAFLVTVLSFVLAAVYNNIAFIGGIGLAMGLMVKAIILSEIINKQQHKLKTNIMKTSTQREKDAKVITGICLFIAFACIAFASVCLYNIAN